MSSYSMIRNPSRRTSRLVEATPPMQSCRVAADDMPRTSARVLPLHVLSNAYSIAAQVRSRAATREPCNTSSASRSARSRPVNPAGSKREETKTWKKLASCSLPLFLTDEIIQRRMVPPSAGFRLTIQRRNDDTTMAEVMGGGRPLHPILSEL